jgi:hypothetical protein
MVGGRREQEGRRRHSMQWLECTARIVAESRRSIVTSFFRGVRMSLQRKQRFLDGVIAAPKDAPGQVAGTVARFLLRLWMLIEPRLWHTRDFFVSHDAVALGRLHSWGKERGQWQRSTAKSGGRAAAFTAQEIGGVLYGVLFELGGIPRHLMEGLTNTPT